MPFKGNLIHNFKTGNMQEGLLLRLEERQGPRDHVLSLPLALPSWPDPAASRTRFPQKP